MKPSMQSAVVAHVVLHAAVPHRYGAQLTAVCRQLPAPSQAPTGVEVDPLHEAVPQLVPSGVDRQAPLPLQVPSKPQGGAGRQPPCGSIAPTATGLHVPADPATLHDVQVPQLAVEQQTPSTQLPRSHSEGAAQIWPRRFLPHEPALQNMPATQSASTPQAARQVVPLQVYGAHDWVLAGWHMPAPSQVRASVAVVVPVGHSGAAHCVPAG